jgi:hypothetical protein
MAFLFFLVETKCLLFSFFSLECFCLQLFCFCSALDLLHWRFFQFFRAFQEKTHITGHSLFTWWSLDPLDLCILCISDSSFKMSVEKRHILGEEGKGREGKRSLRHHGCCRLFETYLLIFTNHLRAGGRF